MKSRFIASLAVLALGLSGALSISALAQTTEETPAPTGSAQRADGDRAAGAGRRPSQQTILGRRDNLAPRSLPKRSPGGPEGEAPAKTDQGVARVSLIHGDVSTQRGDSGDWSAAVLNQPVMTGDKVSTGDNARTELQLDFANTFRLGANAKANIANLTHRDIQIQLSQGLARSHRFETERSRAGDRYAERVGASRASGWRVPYRSAVRMATRS